MLRKIVISIMFCGLGFAAFAQKYIDVNVTLPSDTSCITSVQMANVYPMIIISPNPNKGSFTIEITNFNQNQITRLIITNYLGITIFSQKYEHLPSTKIQIILPNVTKGLYIVTVESMLGNISKKLIIE